MGNIKFSQIRELYWYAKKLQSKSVGLEIPFSFI